MAQTAAEAAVLESTAGKFDQVDDSLNSMLSRLMNELEALRSGWQGNAGRSFEQVKLAYEANQKQLSTALRETASAIRSSGQNYTATDESSASTVGSVNTDINLSL